MAQVFPPQGGVIGYEVTPLNDLVNAEEDAEVAEFEGEAESSVGMSASLGGLF